MDLSVNMAIRIAEELRDRLSPPPRRVPTLPADVRDWATDDEEPTLAHPVWQLCTASQFDEPQFLHWCREMGRAPVNHRKLWEFVYILEVLRQHGKLRPGCKGLGFGTGKEPLPAVMANHGVHVLATDLDTRRAAARGWVDGRQHSAQVADLNAEGLCDPQRFAELVRFQFADMNAVSPDLTDFDFCWSACALEHLGTIDAGVSFIEQSLGCLRPGGVAVHTTEYNCSSDERTIAHGPTVIFRMQDFLRLAARLRSKGHQVKLNFNQGHGEMDRYVDVPPFTADVHLKLRLMRYVSTSIGLAVVKS